VLRSRSTTLAGLAATVAVTVAAAPALADRPVQDLRSPDARDAATRGHAQQADLHRHLAAPLQDLRSPDARDAARGVVAGTVTVTPAVPVGAAPAGFAWDDAAVGGGAVLGLVLLTAGGGVMLVRRRAVRTFAS
jgi:hypothetical protein